jgi:hypothetical protein
VLLKLTHAVGMSIRVAVNIPRFRC